MTYLYELLLKSQLFDLHHLETKKMTQDISLEHGNAFSVNFINIGIFSVFWFGITLVTTHFQCELNVS